MPQTPGSGAPPDPPEAEPPLEPPLEFVPPLDDPPVLEAPPWVELEPPFAEVPPVAPLPAPAAPLPWGCGSSEPPQASANQAEIEKVRSARVHFIAA
jgi:hypothetical protein